VVGFGVEGVVVFFWAFAGLCRVWGHPACGPRVSPWVVRCVVGGGLVLSRRVFWLCSKSSAKRKWVMLDLSAFTWR
jgi:hypothetical protein